jgi:uncharacterized protein (TIGR02391 family)
VNKIDHLALIASRLTNLQPVMPTTEHIEPHAFDARDVHPDLPKKVRDLFDDGYYAQATFEACKYLDNLIRKYAPNTKFGESRMMTAFKDEGPLIQLNPLTNESEKDEQRGYRFLFAGTMVAIRNPLGHEEVVDDDPFTCLDHLALVSTLIRRLDKAGYTK